MRKLLLMLTSLFMVVACDPVSKDVPESTNLPPTETAIPLSAEPDSTEPPEFIGPVFQPRQAVDEGLEVVSQTFYTSPSGYGYLAYEIRNASDEIVPNIMITSRLLDSQNRERDSISVRSPFLNIPPDATIPLLVQFQLPEDYTATFTLIENDSTAGGSFANYQARFDFPASLDDLPTDQMPLVVSGTITNDTDEDFLLPVISISAYDEGGKLIGIAGGFINEIPEAGIWEAGATLSINATFSSLANPQIAETRVFSAAYSVP